MIKWLHIHRLAVRFASQTATGIPLIPNTKRGLGHKLIRWSLLFVGKIDLWNRQRHRAASCGRAWIDLDVFNGLADDHGLGWLETYVLHSWWQLWSIVVGFFHIWHRVVPHDLRRSGRRGRSDHGAAGLFLQELGPPSIDEGRTQGIPRGWSGIDVHGWSGCGIVQIVEFSHRLDRLGSERFVFHKL